MARTLSTSLGWSLAMMSGSLMLEEGSRSSAGAGGAEFLLALALGRQKIPSLGRET